MFLSLILLSCGTDSGAIPPSSPGPSDDTATPLASLDTGDSGPKTDTQDTQDTQDTTEDCAWSGGDPGTLGPETGNQPGDTFADLAVTDQCLNTLSLWDLAGEYHLLYFTGAW